MHPAHPNLWRRLCTIVLLSLLTFTACTFPATAPSPAVDEATSAGQTRSRLVIGVPYLPAILDIQQAYAGSLESTEQIGQALVRLDASTGELLPDLAESWSFSADGTRLTLTLLAGAVYANGDPLDAQAVKDAWLRNKELSPYANDLAALIEINVIDATTVEAVFSAPPAAFLTVLSTSMGGPWNAAVAKAVGNEAFAAAPIASGPLMVKTFTPGSELLLTRNEHYQTKFPLVENKGPLHLEEVLVRMIPEAVTLAGELETGGVDLVLNVPATVVARLRNNPELQIMEVRQPGFAGLAMNLQHPFFADLLVRQAIAHAVDRASLVKVIEGATPLYTFVTPGMVAYDPAVASEAQALYPPDLAAAQALLTEAGWVDTDGDGIVEKAGEPFQVELLIDTGALEQELASQVLQSQLQAIGIAVEIRQLDAALVRESKVAGDYALGFELYSWPDPDILLFVFGTDFWNFPHYENPALLDALAAARVMLDPAARIQAYAAIQRQLITDVVEIPLWQDTFYIAAHQRVQGLVITENLQLFLNDVTVAE